MPSPTDDGKRTSLPVRDIKHLYVDESCMGTSPCMHDVVIVMKDGRSFKTREDSPDICRIIRAASLSWPDKDMRRHLLEGEIEDGEENKAARQEPLESVAVATKSLLDPPVVNWRDAQNAFGMSEDDIDVYEYRRLPEAQQVRRCSCNEEELFWTYWIKNKAASEVAIQYHEAEIRRIRDAFTYKDEKNVKRAKGAHVKPNRRKRPY